MSATDQVVAVAGVGICATLLALAWGFYWMSRFHSAKAEVYQKFADTYSGMRDAIYSKKEQRKMESLRRYHDLALVDPLVRDGLRSALESADAHWGQFQRDASNQDSRSQ